MGFFSCRRKSAVLTQNSVPTTTNPTSPPNIRIFRHDELTSNFSPSTFLGRGSQASIFLASLDNGHLLAAAKIPSLDNEIEILSSLPYSPHIVNLIGHTPPVPNPRIAIVELMPLGSLHSLIHSPFPPPFPHRLRLALQIAKAVASLHSLHPRLIHRDIKPSNILIDVDGNARLSDFGSAVRILEGTPATAAPEGTMGYIDPGYVVPEDISTKNDVYSFGVVLLEILSGRRAIDVEYSPPSVVAWAEMMIRSERYGDLCHPRGGPADDVAVRDVAVLAGRCVGLEAEGRPGMAEVVQILRSVDRRVRSPPKAAWRRLSRRARDGIDSVNGSSESV